MIKILFENHEGVLNIDTNAVRFYSHGFGNIKEAQKFLREIKVPILQDQYVVWRFRHKKCLKNPVPSQFSIRKQYILCICWKPHTLTHFK